ncbi:MAG: DUF1571 domain-containing protein [Planctomycetaceae bacterium]
MVRRWLRSAAAGLFALIASGALPPGVLAGHPLDVVLEFAHDEQAYLQRTVRDFTCRVTKRERIDGELQDHRYIDMQVREPRVVGTRVMRPLSVLLEFVGPSDVEGRRVLFVAGQHDDRLLVRKGGRRFGYVITDLDPSSTLVKQESLMPIAEIGFSQVLDRTIRALQQDIAADPRGDNTIVERITTATINGRPCQMLRITHPLRRDGLQFFSASMAVDAELHVPVRFDVYDWPDVPGQPPPLVSEFTYTNVALNVNLDDAVFSPAMLRRP